MARIRAYPPMPEDDSHEATGPEYMKECQRIIDQNQWRGDGQSPFPDKIIVHEYEPMNSDEVQHIYQPKPDKDDR